MKYTFKFLILLSLVNFSCKKDDCNEPSKNTSPTVKIISPLNNASFDAPASFSIKAEASDSEGSITEVIFYNGNDVLGTDLEEPYEFLWENVEEGHYTIIAKAKDNEGLITTSDIVSVDVKAVVPSWAYFSNAENVCPSYINIGDADVEGSKMTIEARIINIPESQLCIPTPYPNSYDIISKHYNPSNVNYLLRPNYAQISTVDGFFTTSEQPIAVNKTQHIAMVYDGNYLKFYIDGCVVDEVAATGDLVSNDLDARIGFMAVDQLNRSEQFFGYIDELRIWKTARTEEEIREFANSELASPETDFGLVAYYNFNEDFKNKQGNAEFHGIITGNPSLKETSLDKGKAEICN